MKGARVSKVFKQYCVINKLLGTLNLLGAAISSIKTSIAFPFRDNIYVWINLSMTFLYLLMWELYGSLEMSGHENY